MASVGVVRLARAPGQTGLPAKGSQGPGFPMRDGPGRLLWVVSAALVPVALGALLLLYMDALKGYHQIWPVYAFASVGVACAVVWSCLAAKLFAR